MRLCRSASQRRPNLTFIRRYELSQGFYGLFGILAFRTDGYLLTLFCQPRNLQYALGVDLPITLDDEDLRRELLRCLNEPRRRPTVDPFVRPDRRLSLSHDSLLSP